jgi:mannitol/fructose-specific phosphotransferase system IIA component (Ntr-type)
MGAPRGQGIRQRIFGTPMDRITRHATCSVLRLKTPRHQTHDVITTGEFPALNLKSFDIQDYLEPGCLGARLDVSRKDRLFTTLAESFVRVHPQLDVEEVERALWERERTQNTAVGMGLALPHATIRSLPAPCLGIFTMASPLDYQAPDGEPVDVIFVTLGPPSGRRIHLELLSSVSRMVLSTDLLDDLRSASDPDQMAECFARHAGAFGQSDDPHTGET